MVTCYLLLPSWVNKRFQPTQSIIEPPVLSCFIYPFSPSTTPLCLQNKLVSQVLPPVLYGLHCMGKEMLKMSGYYSIFWGTIQTCHGLDLNKWMCTFLFQNSRNFLPFFQFPVPILKARMALINHPTILSHQFNQFHFLLNNVVCIVVRHPEGLDLCEMMLFFAPLINNYPPCILSNV